MRRATDFFRFGPVRQEVGAKHVRKGDLIEAVNVRQTNKAGVYSKREGFVRTAQTFSGGSLSGDPLEALPGSGRNTLMRDSGDQLWSREDAANQWALMGTNRRTWVDTAIVQSNQYTTPQPFCVLVGTRIWVFALKGSSYEFTVTDATTGAVSTSRQTIVATNIVHASAAYDGTYVWVFWVDNGANGTVRCHKFTAATPTVAPTATDYYTFSAGVATVALQQVQARYLSALGKVAVCACGGSKVTTTYKRAVMHSYLDPATGQSAASPAAVEPIAYSGTIGPYTIGGLYIMDGQDGSADWYYAFVNWNTATAYYGNMTKVNKTTLANTNKSFNAQTGATSPIAHQCVGFVDNAQDIQCCWINTRINASPWTDMTFTQITAGTEVSPGASQLLRKSWIASGFAYVAGKWQCLIGYDDWNVHQTAMGLESTSYQRCYRVGVVSLGATGATTSVDFTGQFLVGNGCATWHNNTGAIAFAAGTPPLSTIAPVVVVGNTIKSAVAAASATTGYVDLIMATVDTAKVFGTCAQAMGMAFCPGNIPVVWSGKTPPHEVAPLMAPDYLTATAGTGTSYSIAAVCYAIYDNDGTVWRSAPKVISKSFGYGATLTTPGLPFATIGTRILVEFYIGTNATPKLQTAVVANSNTQTFTTPVIADMVNGEILYTTGNALANTWPVACQAVAAWNNRLFFAQGNKVFVSKELEPGFGPVFNEVQTSTWSEEREEITAMAPVDMNYLAVLSESQVAVISGPGPDGVGNGNYSVKTLSFHSGLVHGGAAIQGAGGCYFQTVYNGRIMVITPGLQVAEAAGGAYDYSAYTFTTGAWYEGERMMVFFAPASHVAVVIDYLHAGDATPFGQVYLWTFAAGLTTSAVTVDHDGVVIVGSGGGIYRSSSSAYVDGNVGGTTDTYDMDLVTAELQFGDIQGEITIAKVQALLSVFSESGVYVETYPSYASQTQADSRVTSVLRDLAVPTNLGDTRMVMTRPPNCSRVPSIRVRIREKSGVTGRSFEFEGLAIEYTTSGRLWHPPSGDVI